MKAHFFANLKIFAAIITAFVLVQIITPIIFPFNNPRINYFFLTKLFPKKPANQNSQTQLNFSAMQTLAPGIYAKEDKESNTIYIRVTKEARWQEKIIESDGKKIIILYPKKD